MRIWPALSRVRKAFQAMMNIAGAPGQVIEDLPNYEFDVIEFAQLLGETKSVLAVVGILMMHAWNLLEKLEIQPETMYRYLIWVGSNMIKTNAYHNEMHVADVVQSVCLLLGKHVDTDMTVRQHSQPLLLAAVIQDKQT